jgi:acetyltransferase-like isoleucine patch superfamily enzyme
MAGFWPVRWLRAAFALARGIRVHPTAVVSGGTRRVRLARNCSVGARCRLSADASGRIVIGEGCWFASDVELDTATAIQIGAGTTVQRRSSIMGSTRLGRGCILAPNVFVSSGTHPFRSFPELPIRRQEALAAQDPALAASLDRPVWIQDDCWLGANVVVGPGVVIGRGSVIGANAVVLQDVPPYSVAAGVPARVVGKRLDWIPPASVTASREEDHVYVLCGPVLPATDGMSAGFSVAPGDPLHVAVARAARVRVEYQARTGLRVRVGQILHELQLGRHTLELDAAQLEARGNHLVLAIEAVSEDTPACLRITSIGAS